MNLDTKTNQFGLFSDDEEYRTFTEKFKTKKTTDDCYTPENVYQAVADWVEAEYNVDAGEFVRPFWPGGDYQAFEYPEGCVVVDNPPFSILTKIYDFYLLRGIRFFLFAPTMTLFSGTRDVTYIPCGVTITYENGAKVNTSFTTNLDTLRVRSAPTLYEAVYEENKKNEKTAKKNIPKYDYPNHLLTAAASSRYSRYGVEYQLQKDDCMFRSALDEQKEHGKTIFGGGFLLSDKAAAERAAAERAAARQIKKWQLSEREWRIVEALRK